MLSKRSRCLSSYRRTKLSFWGAWRLVLRKLITPFFQFPVLITTPNGARLRIGLESVDEKILYHMLIKIPEWYFPTSTSKIPKSPLILDIGSHRGFYATLALMQYPNSLIICVEPSLSLLNDAKANIKLNGWQTRAEFIHGAISEESGFGFLQTSHASWGFRLNYEGSKEIKCENTPLLTLEEILHGREPDIIKCNAEGGEYALVNQLKHSSMLPKLVIIMAHDGLGIGNSKDLINEMKNMGFRVDDLSGGSDSPTLHFWLADP